MPVPRETTASKIAISPRVIADDECVVSRVPDDTLTLFLSSGAISQHFALKRHLLSASLYRK